jgi:hypothetical protein
LGGGVETLGKITTDGLAKCVWMRFSKEKLNAKNVLQEDLTARQQGLK